MKYHAAQSEVRATFSTPVDRRLASTYPGTEPSLATDRTTVSTPGSDSTEGSVPQRSRASSVPCRPPHQQDRPGHGTLPEPEDQWRHAPAY
jgi:hypothetical protein